MGKYILATTAAFFVLSAAHAGEPAQGPAAQAVDSACTADAATAGCGSEQVGTGLMHCLHKYKKTHKDFKLSDGCKSAMKQMHEKRMEKMEH